MQFNPPQPVRWKLNTQYAPVGVKPEVKAAFKQLSAATGIRFVYAGKTKAIPGSDRRWPGNTNMVVAWAKPSQTEWNLYGNTIGRGGQIKTAFARTAKGKRAYRSPIRAGPGQHLRGARWFRRPERPWLDHRARAGHVVGLGHTGDNNQQMSRPPRTSGTASTRPVTSTACATSA